MDQWERDAKRAWDAAPKRIRGPAPLALVLDVKRQLPEPLRGLRVRPPTRDALDLSARGPHHDLTNAWAAWAYRRGNALLLLDEVDLSCRSPGHVPPGVVAALHHGRARGLAPVMCCRRYCEILPEVRSQCEDLFIFRTNEPADVEHFAGRGIPVAPRGARPEPHHLQGLPVGAFYHLRTGDLTGAHFHRDALTSCPR